MTELEKNKFNIGASGSEYTEKYGFYDPEKYVFKAKKGLSREIVEEISWMKSEPEWMRAFRLRALETFYKKPMPQWGGNLNDIDFTDIYYFLRATDKSERSWDEVPEDIKRTFDRLGIPEAEKKFLAGVGAQYECLSGDAQVYTARGLVPIQDVQAGDTVFSFDETTDQLIASRVTATAAKGVRPVFEVRVGTRTIKATDNHPFLVLDYQRAPGKERGRYHRTWKYLRELEPGDLVAVAKQLPDVGQAQSLTQPAVKTTVVGRNQAVEYTLDISARYNSINLPSETSPDLMWWLGLYIGDGFIHHQADADKARVEFAIPKTDAALRAEFSRVTEGVFGIAAKNGDPQRMTVYSTILARFLEANNLDGTAHTKRIPSWVFTLPQEQILAFIGGYVDADGYVRDAAKNHDVVLTSANPDLLQDVRELSALCGLPTSTIHRFESKHPVDATRTTVGYRIQIAGAFERIGSRSPQRTLRLNKRKYHHDYSSAHNTTFRQHTNEFIGFAKIDSITPAGNEPVFDIEVAGPHNFVAEGLVVHNSEVVYHNIQESLKKQGVIFVGMDQGLAEYPDIVKKYFGTVIPLADNKFAALNSAVWSGGSFIYVPPGVRVEMPLQAYFRINAQNMGQFERTLIIADEGSYVHYVEGCFSAGARVRTRDGEKTIETIREGDEVLTHRGRHRRVYRTMQRPYQGNLHHIRYYGDSGQQLHVTAEHPILAVRRERANERNRQFNPEWLTAADLKPGDYLTIPVPQSEQPARQTYDTTIPFGRGRHAPVENAPRPDGQTLVLASTEIARVFANEFGSTVYEKRVPEWVQNASLDCLAELVRGMWRGDGSYDAKKNMFRYNTISRNLAYAFRDALLRLGVAASVKMQMREEPRQDIYAVVVSSPWNSKFGALVGQPAPDGRPSGSPFYLDEKYLYAPIRAIEIEEVETTVYNFSVEEDESYIGEGVVSHNCTAPTYSSDSLHSAVVEIVINKGARVRYTTIQNWSSNVYNLVTKRAVAHQDATMEWVDCNLGCLAQGSTVTTPAGVVPIEQVEIGDKVLSYDEHTGQLCFRRVLAKRFSGNQPVHTVAIGERRLRATANHPFYSYVYDETAPKKLGRYQLAYVRADHLTEAIVPRTSLDYGAPYRLQRPSLVTQFDSRNQYAEDLVMTRARDSRITGVEYTTDALMWLFGYWLGDGNIEIKSGKTDNVIRWAKIGFSTPTTDRARARLMETMATVLDAPPFERADGVHVTWSSKELAEFFRVNGFDGNARTKRVPQWVWSLPESQRLSFIAGYLDADGHVHESRRLTLKSVNRALLEDVASLLVTLGITPRLYTEFDEPRNVTILGIECVAHGAHRLTFPLDARLLPHLSPAFRQRAEAERPAVLEHHRTIGRSNIELPETVAVAQVQVSEPSDELAPTWDIEVEGTGNFVSQGFIVHNSKLTMKYPAVYMMGEGAHGEVLSVAFAGSGQHQDAGAKMVHAAPNTSSLITSKSISKDGGRTSYRGLLKVYPGCDGVKSNVRCDALLLDEQSRSDTYPYIEVDEDNVQIGHEASVSKIGEEQLFYLMSRGLSEAEAATMIVSGFIEPIVKELPMEFAVEMNRLLSLQMEGSVG